MSQLDSLNPSAIPAQDEALRQEVRAFLVEAMRGVPAHVRARSWTGYDPEFSRKLGRRGWLGITFPPAYGGAGLSAFARYVLVEEFLNFGAPVGSHWIADRQSGPLLLKYGTEAQKQKYLPKLASGEMVGAIAMSEPAAGSDLQGVKTTAIWHAGPSGSEADGHYVINGSKTFITNGWHADLVILVAKTDPAAGAKGTSLFLIERGTPGFEKGKRLKKLGLKAQDTSELFFDNVKVSADQLLGGAAMQGKGFICLMEQLPWERLQIAIGGIAAAQAAIDWTVQYVKDRKVFGQAVGNYQNTRYTLAELQTEVQVARVFVDKCTELLLQDKLDTATASMAKYWCSDLQCKVMDECVQLHGGYGYMWEYPITRAYADARVQRIYGGTNEIMKEVITRSMGLGK